MLTFVLLLLNRTKNFLKINSLTTINRHKTITCTYLIRSTAPGEKVPVVIAMNGQVKDAGVVIESLLGPVAVVNIPVHDEDLVDVQSLLQKFGCNGHRVEVAETPETRTLGGSFRLQVKVFILPETRT